MVAIRQQVLDELVAHARAEAPLECCGLLMGGTMTENTTIDSSIPARNILASPTRYQVDPDDHFAAIRRARGESREIVGAYHSHPRSAPDPSPTDIAEAAYPDFIYVIVSLVDPSRPEVRGFRIGGGNVKAMPLVPVP